MYYQYEPRFNGVYSRDNLPDKVKDGAYVINLDEYSDIGTHWICKLQNPPELIRTTPFINFQGMLKYKSTIFFL